MDRETNRAIEENGYAFIPTCLSGRPTIEVASMFGVPLVPWEGAAVQTLMPRREAPPNTYGGIYGLDRFPYHTDLAHWRRPPRYLMLRCVTGYADVATLLLDGRKLITEVPIDLLTRAIFKPRRPRDGKLCLLRLYERTDEACRLRWDEVFIEPASTVGSIAADHLRRFLSQAKPIPMTLEQPSDTLIIDNWRMFHARSVVPTSKEDRKIERVYLESLH